MKKNEIVSFDDEKLIIVDPDDNIIDYKDKMACHLNDGILHRAFSVFIFNEKKELLLHKRSGQKFLWPLFWTNSCCSHPRKGESYQQAVKRRVKEELGIETELKFLFKFQYQAAFEDKGSEHELCSVYIGKYNGAVQVNENEIADWKFVDTDQMEKDMAANPDLYTPWFKMEWQRIKKEFFNEIENL